MSEKQFVDKIMRMTVPELQNELNMMSHTVVEQMILRDLIRRRVEQEYICQADKNFYIKQRSYASSCITGTPSAYPKGTNLSKYCLSNLPDSCPLNAVSASVNPYLIDPRAKEVIIKDDPNKCRWADKSTGQLFFQSDFKDAFSDYSSSTNEKNNMSNEKNNTTNENDKLSSRFFDDIRAIRQTHKKNDFGDIVY